MYGFTPVHVFMSDRVQVEELEDGSFVYTDESGNPLSKEEGEKRLSLFYKYLWIDIVVLPILSGVVGGLVAKPIAKEITNKTLSQVALFAIPSLVIAMSARRFLYSYPLLYTLRKKELRNKISDEPKLQALSTLPIFMGAGLGLLVSKKTKNKSMLPIVIGGMIPAYMSAFLQNK